MNLASQFGELIRVKRLEKGISQKDLSLLIWEKPNPAYVYNLEKNRLPNITLNTIERFLEALDVDVNVVEFTDS